MADNKAEQIKAFKAWALEKYHDGADVFIECYDDEEIEEFLLEHGGLNGAIKAARKIAKRSLEQRDACH